MKKGDTVMVTNRDSQDATCVGVVSSIGEEVKVRYNTGNRGGRYKYTYEIYDLWEVEPYEVVQKRIKDSEERTREYMIKNNRP